MYNKRVYDCCWLYFYYYSLKYFASKICQTKIGHDYFFNGGNANWTGTYYIPNYRSVIVWSANNLLAKSGVFKYTSIIIILESTTRVTQQ
jgi:hypothetical protein